MRLVPETNQGKIDFYTAHVSRWQTHAAALGIPAAFADELVDALDAARAALEAQARAKLAAEAATLRANVALERLCIRGSGAIKFIHSTAQAGDPGVYALAQIPALKKSRTKVPSPGVPHAFVATLTFNGRVSLAWQSQNPRAGGATMYELRRRVGDAGPWETVGYVAKKAYTDRAIPPGTARVEYQVRAVRSTGRSDWGLHVVDFGRTFNPPDALARREVLGGRPPTLAA